MIQEDHLEDNNEAVEPVYDLVGDIQTEIQAIRHSIPQACISRYRGYDRQSRTTLWRRSQGLERVYEVYPMRTLDSFFSKPASVLQSSQSEPEVDQ